MKYTQSDTAKVIPFLLVSSTDHNTPVTGLGSGPTVTLSKNGASFAAAAGTVTESGNGWYALTPTSADTGTLGPLIIHASGTGSDLYDFTHQIVSVNFYDSAAFGMSRLDATISGIATSVWALGTRTLTAISDSSGITTLLTRIAATLNVANVNTLAGHDPGATIGTSTYSGADTSGTTTLLTRLTATRAGLLDNLSNLDAVISGIATAVWGTATRTLTAFAFNVGLTAAYDRAKNALAVSEYTAPDNTTIANINTNVNSIGTIVTSIQTTVNSTSTTVGTINTATAAINAKTAQLRFTITNQVDANALTGGGGGGGGTQIADVRYINGIPVTTSNITIQYGGPISDSGEMTLVRGSAYKTIYSNAIIISVLTTALPTLSPTSVVLRDVSLGIKSTPLDTASVSVVGSSTLFTFELEDEATAALTLFKRDYAVWYVYGGTPDDVIIASGELTVIDP